jgi:hypothetical protein
LLEEVANYIELNAGGQEDDDEGDSEKESDNAE